MTRSMSKLTSMKITMHFSNYDLVIIILVQLKTEEDLFGAQFGELDKCI